MYFPSERTRAEMDVSQGGLWLDQANTCLLVTKLPTHLIKAIRGGAKACLVVSAVTIDGSTVRCVGLRISDDPTKPVTVFRTHRAADEHRAFAELLREDVVDCHFFDELSRHVLYSRCRLEVPAKNRLTDSLRGASHYVGDANQATEAALDTFQKILSLPLGSDPGPLTRVVPLEFVTHTPTRIYAIGSGRFILDEDEGGGLEQSAHQLMEYLFPASSYRSPLVEHGGVYRELTDSLATCNGGLCLLETKALSVFNTDPARSTERRARQIRKAIDKGLSQLRGAVRKIRSSAIIRSNKQPYVDVFAPDAPILIQDRATALVNGIVLISDMHAGIDWKELAEVITSDTTDRALLHVMDLHEWRTLVGHCKTPDLLMLNLARRWTVVKEGQTALVRSRRPPI